MAVFEIPLTPEAQTFQIAMGGASYQMTLQWRDAPMGGWFLDIATRENVAMISGMAMVTGVNLLDQFAYLNFGVALYVQSDGNPDAIPTFENLGIESKLYFVTV